MMRKLLLVALSLMTVTLAACGTSQPTAGTGGSPAPSSSVTSQQIAAVAERVFPKVAQQGYYGVCGVDGNVAACPYTDRLKARLTELHQTLIRAQNPSDTREVTAEIMSPDAGIAHIKLFQGRQLLDLFVVRQAQALLVDDEICAGRKDTSIYAPFVAC